MPHPYLHLHGHGHAPSPPPSRSRAKDLCPDLIVVPYMFDKYEETSEKVGLAVQRTLIVLAAICAGLFRLVPNCR